MAGNAHTRLRSEPLSLLILLGFICQGFAFANTAVAWAVASLYTVLWVVCLRLRRESRSLPRGVEELITLGAIYLAYTVGGDYGYNRLVFIGHALVVYQGMHLLRPLSIREKMYSTAVSLIHLTVGAQVIVDYQFVLILAAAVYLLPRSLQELEAERCQGLAAGRRSHFRWQGALAITVCMVLFFLFFPRYRVTRYGMSLGGPSARERDELEMAESASDPGSTMLFRIHGEGLSYIKRAALDTWDGRTWRASPAVFQPQRFLDSREVEGALQRSVKTFNYRLLDHYLPADGYVVQVAGPFVQRPYVAGHGGVMVPLQHRQNISYEYWTHAAEDRDELSPRDRQRYVQTPGLSEQARRWLDSLVGNLTDPRVTADRLAEYLQTNYEYRLGAPDLDRLNPLDDFLFGRQEGHCERFASALAALLRARGIPARIALGWLALEKNELGGFYNVRTRHAHAWTEVWIDGKGWINVDATPYGQDFRLESRPLRLTVYEWIEYLWYSKIVEFDVSEQRSVVDFVGRQIQGGMNVLTDHLPVIAGLLLVVPLIFVIRLRGWPARWTRATPDPRQSQRKARHFYGRMLRILARQHFDRGPAETPLEFLRSLDAVQHPRSEDIREVTLCFCEIRYGDRLLSADQAGKMKLALRRIAKPRV